MALDTSKTRLDFLRNSIPTKTEPSPFNGIWKIPVTISFPTFMDTDVLSDAGGGKRVRRFLDDAMAYGIPMDDVWQIAKLNRSDKMERTGYPTQKPLALLRRAIKVSSNPGDVVCDPFCGCATTCVTAEQLGRQWIGVDISIKAYDLVREHLVKEVANPGDVFQYDQEIHLKTDPPKRTDQGVDYRETKFVYVISHPSYPGEYKVGIAKNRKSRLHSYQTSDPDRQYRMEFSPGNSTFPPVGSPYPRHFPQPA